MSELLGNPNSAASLGDVITGELIYKSAVKEVNPYQSKGYGELLYNKENNNNVSMFDETVNVQNLEEDPEKEINTQRAANQGFGYQAAAAFRFVPNAVIDIGSQIGAIGVLPSYLGITDYDPNNWGVQLMKNMQAATEYVNKTIPIYTNPDEIDSGYIMSNLSNVLTTASSFAATGYATGGLTSLGTRGLIAGTSKLGTQAVKLGANTLKVEKALDYTAKGINATGVFANAALMNGVESAYSGNAVFETVKSELTPLEYVANGYVQDSNGEWYNPSLNYNKYLEEFNKNNPNQQGDPELSSRLGSIQTPQPKPLTEDELYSKYVENMTKLNAERKASGKSEVAVKSKDQFQTPDQIAKSVVNKSSEAAVLAMDMNKGNILLNLSGAARFMKPFKSAKLASITQKIEKPEVLWKSMLHETAQEYLEESTTAVAEKSATEWGIGNVKNKEFLLDQYFTKETQEQGFWGAMGGTVMTGLQHIGGKKARAKEREAYDKQQAEINDIDAMFMESGGNSLRNTLDNFKNQSDLIQEFDNTEDPEVKERLKKKILKQQAASSFMGGTYDVLQDKYNELANKSVEQIIETDNTLSNDDAVQIIAKAKEASKKLEKYAEGWVRHEINTNPYSGDEVFTEMTNAADSEYNREVLENSKAKKIIQINKDLQTTTNGNVNQKDLETKIAQNKEIKDLNKRIEAETNNIKGAYEKIDYYKSEKYKKAKIDKLVKEQKKQEEKATKQKNEDDFSNIENADTAEEQEKVMANANPEVVKEVVLSEGAKHANSNSDNIDLFDELSRQEQTPETIIQTQELKQNINNEIVEAFRNSNQKTEFLKKIFGNRVYNELKASATPEMLLNYLNDNVDITYRNYKNYKENKATNTKQHEVVKPTPKGEQVELNKPLESTTVVPIVTQEESIYDTPIEYIFKTYGIKMLDFDIAQFADELSMRIDNGIPFTDLGKKYAPELSEDKQRSLMEDILQIADEIKKCK